MGKHTFKILRCEHRKVLKYVWPFFKIMKEGVKICGRETSGCAPIMDLVTYKYFEDGTNS